MNLVAESMGARSWARWAHGDVVNKEEKDQMDLSRLSADYLKNIMETVSSAIVQAPAKVGCYQFLLNVSLVEEISNIAFLLIFLIFFILKKLVKSQHIGT